LSTTENAARVLKSLKDEEWRTLAGLERSTSGYGTPDLGRLARMSRLPFERVEFATTRLKRKGSPCDAARGSCSLGRGSKPWP